jgi:hypothetical protein
MLLLLHCFAKKNPLHIDNMCYLTYTHVALTQQPAETHVAILTYALAEKEITKKDGRQQSNASQSPSRLAI